MHPADFVISSMGSLLAGATLTAAVVYFPFQSLKKEWNKAAQLGLLSILIVLATTLQWLTVVSFDSSELGVANFRPLSASSYVTVAAYAGLLFLLSVLGAQKRTLNVIRLRRSAVRSIKIGFFVSLVLIVMGCASSIATAALMFIPRFYDQSRIMVMVTLSLVIVSEMTVRAFEWKSGLMKERMASSTIFGVLDVLLVVGTMILFNLNLSDNPYGFLIYINCGINTLSTVFLIHLNYSAGRTTKSPMETTISPYPLLYTDKSASSRSGSVLSVLSGHTVVAGSMVSVIGDASMSPRSTLRSQITSVVSSTMYDNDSILEPQNPHPAPRRIISPITELSESIAPSRLSHNASPEQSEVSEVKVMDETRRRFGTVMTTPTFETLQVPPVSSGGMRDTKRWTAGSNYSTDSTYFEPRPQDLPPPIYLARKKTFSEIEQSLDAAAWEQVRFRIIPVTPKTPRRWK